MLVHDFIKTGQFLERIRYQNVCRIVNREMSVYHQDKFYTAKKLSIKIILENLSVDGDGVSDCRAFTVLSVMKYKTNQQTALFVHLHKHAIR